MSHAIARHLARGVLLATAAALWPASFALAQATDDLPRSGDTRPADTSLTPPPPRPQPVVDYVESLRKELNTAPKAGAEAEGAKPQDAKAAGAAEKGGAVSIQRELLWEEDLDQFQRARKPPPRKLLQGGVSEVHVVQPGDTLWDLSSRYLNSPWLWPRVWSYNPHITNPHWIYPGQVVRFRPLVASAPTLTDEPPLTPKIDKIIPGHMGVRTFRHITFVTKEEIKKAGKLEHSPNDQMMLSRFHSAYVGFEKPQEVKVGDKFLSARLGPEIEHPATGKSMGRVVIYTGELEVTAVAKEGKYYTTTIRNSWRTIHRGNIVLPWEDLVAKTEPRTNGKDLRGYIVSAGLRNLVGKYHLVFIDLGSKQGVELGNRFRIVRRGDGYQREDEYEDNLKKMPLEEVGEAVVLSVKPDTSTALVTRSLTDLKDGDKAEMRKGE